MRHLLLTAAVVCAGACAGPKPCTQALCPLPGDGSYRVSAWMGSVTVRPDVPAVPIVSDSTVEILSGRVFFVNGRRIVSAEAGSSFRFEVSTTSAHTPSISVSTGLVTVALSSSAAGSPVVPGAPYFLLQSEQ
jgi:hypothetical protein